MYSKLPDEFIDFLVSNDALQRYLLQLSPILSDKEYWHRAVEGPWDILVREAFWWKDTIEGICYWEAIHKEWMDYLRRHYNAPTGYFNQVSGNKRSERSVFS